MLPNPSKPRSTRDAKLRAIAELFGETVAERLGRDANGKSADRAKPPVAEEQSQLIAHLHERMKLSEAQHEHPDPVAKPQTTTQALDSVRQASSLDSLAGEHPAVIAQLLRSEPQENRVAILRRLPGTTARLVMQRLKAR